MTSVDLTSLQIFFDSVLNRLNNLEERLENPTNNAPLQLTISEVKEHESLTHYDKHLNQFLKPFIKSCIEINLLDVTKHISTIWTGIRSIIHMSTLCHKPSNIQTSLASYLQPIQSTISSVRNLKLDRKFDYHHKAVLELVNCASWVLLPLPAKFVEDSSASCEFWCNKIRKEYKGKNECHYIFCKQMKDTLKNLITYLKNHHVNGLMWNMRGISVEEYNKDKENNKKVNVHNLCENKIIEVNKSFCSKEKKIETTVFKALGSISGTKNPVCEFQVQNSKWKIENQTETSNPGGICKIHVRDQKEQVYIYQCENATVLIKGKVKNITFDTCVKTNVIFESAISSCEIFNCTKVQIQCAGSCPSYTIDKTKGCLVYLSVTSLEDSNFVTSESSEMNVCCMNEKGDQVEHSIPEQIHHQFVNGKLKSEVSAFYQH